MIDGEDTFVIETKPQYKYSGYTRSIVWMSKKMYQPVKVEYYDRKKSLLKTCRTGQMPVIFRLFVGRRCCFVFVPYTF